MSQQRALKLLEQPHAWIRTGLARVSSALRAGKATKGGRAEPCPACSSRYPLPPQPPPAGRCPGVFHEDKLPLGAPPARTHPQRGAEQRRDGAGTRREPGRGRCRARPLSGSSARRRGPRSARRDRPRAARAEGVGVAEGLAVCSAFAHSLSAILPLTAESCRL